MSSPDADPSAGPAEAVRASRAPLRRSSHDRVLYGVCGGLAERYGVSATAVRIAFAVLALTGVGLAVYVVIAVACPEQGDPRPIGLVRVLAALVAGLVTLAVSAELLHAAGVGRFAIGRSGSLLLIVFLTGLGVALVAGRGGQAVAGGGGEAVAADPAVPARAWPRRLPALRPPVLLLLTLAAAAVAATGAWFATGGPDGRDAFGVVLASAVIVVGLGVTLSAWRGRSFVLLPLGVALAAPLVLVGFADVSLTVGRDNPGVIASATGQERTVVLGQGAGPVEVRGAAVADGLRTLVVRKGIGRVEVIVDRAIPVKLHVVAAGGTVSVDDVANNSYATFGALRGHSMFLAAAGRTPTAPLDLKVAVGFGSVLIEHGLPPVAVAPSLADQLRALRTHVLADIGARTALLRADRRALRRLTAAYTGGLRVLGRAPVTAGRRPLDLPESFWQAVTPSSPGLTSADRALARLDRLRVLRFDLLRAAWRAHAVARGLRRERLALHVLDRRIAAAAANGATP
jgi:phage shock protein C